MEFEISAGNKKEIGLFGCQSAMPAVARNQYRNLAVFKDVED